MKSFIVLSFLVCYAIAVIDWPFQNSPDGGGIAVKANIGSPEQTVLLDVTFNVYCPGVFVYNSSAHPDNSFDASASTTFHVDRVVSDEGYLYGTTGTDDFVIQSSNETNQLLQQRLLNVMRIGTCLGSTLTLTYSFRSYTNDFVDSILADEPKKIVTLTYDRTPTVEDNSVYGKLTFGDSPDICSDFYTFPQPSFEEIQGQFELKKIKVGKFAAYQPGNAIFLFASNRAIFPREVYEQIVSELQINEELSTIPCDINKNITYLIGDLHVDLMPNDYIQNTTTPGVCLFLGDYIEDTATFQIPVQIFERYCLAFDLKVLVY